MLVKNLVLRTLLSAVPSLGAFNGNLEVQLVPVDVAKLTFSANVKQFTGDATKPFIEYTPANDNGDVKVFANADDVIAWLRNAYVDILSVKADFVNFDLITKAFVPPTDALKEAIKQKANYTKKLAAIADNVLMVDAKLASDIASHWNDTTAHPALQAYYANDLAAKTAVHAAKDFYIAQIGLFTSIITP